MAKDTTRKLEERLIQIDSEDKLAGYLDDLESFSKYDGFSEYYESLDKVKNKATAEIVKASGIERSYCYQILNGTRPNPGREKIIRLCLAAQLSLKETLRALKTGNEAVLYARNKRDAIIIFAIEHELSCEDTNLLLDQFNEKPLE